MSDFPPLKWRWTGSEMEPVGQRAKNEADRQFVIGAVYRLVEERERSEISHKHEFAWLRTAWKNLPENIADEYPSPDHLRKAALIEAGFFTQTITDVGTNAAALRMVPIIKAKDQFCVVIVRGPILVVRDAMSQRKRAMPPDVFQRSKQAILEIVAQMIGVSPETLSRNAEKAA